MGGAIGCWVLVQAVFCFLPPPFSFLLFCDFFHWTLVLLSSPLHPSHYTTRRTATPPRPRPGAPIHGPRSHDSRLHTLCLASPRRCMLISISSADTDTAVLHLILHLLFFCFAFLPYPFLLTCLQCCASPGVLVAPGGLGFSFVTTYISHVQFFSLSAMSLFCFYLCIVFE